MFWKNSFEESKYQSGEFLKKKFRDKNDAEKSPFVLGMLTSKQK